MRVNIQKNVDRSKKKKQKTMTFNSTDPNRKLEDISKRQTSFNTSILILHYINRKSSTLTRRHSCVEWFLTYLHPFVESFFYTPFFGVDFFIWFMFYITVFVYLIFIHLHHIGNVSLLFSINYVIQSHFQSNPSLFLGNVLPFKTIFKLLLMQYWWFCLVWFYMLSLSLCLFLGYAFYPLD